MDDGSLTLHMPIVVNAEQYKSAVLQFFFAVCPIFFHLGISRHVLGPCHTCFGHVMGAKGLCNMLQDPLAHGYLACYVPLGSRNMGAYM
jgi:hypothetical protein